MVFRGEAVLDKPSGRYKFAIIDPKDDKTPLYESDPDYDSLDEAEIAAVDFIPDTLQSLP